MEESNRLLIGFSALNHNANLCKKAAGILEDFANADHTYVWIEKPSGETIMLEKGWKIKTAEILPVYSD